MKPTKYSLSRNRDHQIGHFPISWAISVPEMLLINQGLYFEIIKFFGVLALLDYDIDLIFDLNDCLKQRSSSVLDVAVRGMKIGWRQRR